MMQTDIEKYKFKDRPTSYARTSCLLTMGHRIIIVNVILHKRIYRRVGFAAAPVVFLGYVVLLNVQVLA